VHRRVEAERSGSHRTTAAAIGGDHEFCRARRIFCRLPQASNKSDCESRRVVVDAEPRLDHIRKHVIFADQDKDAEN
jgi:hypothetical protein